MIRLPFIIYMVLIASGIWLYVMGYFIKLFNGNSIFYHIADKLDHEPFFRFGILICYLFSFFVLFSQIKKEKEILHLIMFSLASILIVPIYAHIMVNEYILETTPVDNKILPEINSKRLDYAILENYYYDNNTKSLHVTLNYGTEKNKILNKYFHTERALTMNKERAIKRELNRDMMQVINTVWSYTHKPKQIVINIKWGKDTVYMTVAHKKERFLSYSDNDESNNFDANEKSLYYRLDVQKNKESYILKIKNNNGEWIEVSKYKVNEST